MPRQYTTDTDAKIVDFCLNCKKVKCTGNCDELKAEKERISKLKKGTKK